MGSLALLTVAASGFASTGQVFACQLFNTEAEVGDGVVTAVDLRLVTVSDDNWTFDFADGVKGAASVSWFDEQKSHGKIEWADASPTGKISEVSVLSAGWVEGADYLWLSLEGKKAFETPAYGCHTKLGGS